MTSVDPHSGKQVPRSDSADSEPTDVRFKSRREGGSRPITADLDGAKGFDAVPTDPIARAPSGGGGNDDAAESTDPTAHTDPDADPVAATDPDANPVAGTDPDADPVVGTDPDDLAATTDPLAGANLGANDDLEDGDTDEHRNRGGPHRVRPGTIVDGRFEVIRRISRGGMADIYEAEQVSVGRRVALKIVSRKFAEDSHALARFSREAAILAKINHPNIVTVHDIGTTESGDPFIAMEFVSGSALSQMIASRGRIACDDAVSILLQISRALGTVHERGVIHRDLKPGNILLSTSASGVTVAKIADFGLAKVLEGRSLGSFLTRVGTILGTPEYMSPEQIRGAEIDARADIYSLGCMAYEMFSGTPPFVGQEEMSTLYRHLHEKPLPLNKACPEADIPAPFQRLVERSMAKEADNRIGSAFKFYRALLAAADEAGIAREKLHLVESLFDDPAYARHHYTAPSVAETPHRPRRGGLERFLIVATMVVVALVAGVAIERMRGAAPAPSVVTSPASGQLIVVSRPPGAEVAVDGVSSGETTPTAIANLAPGSHTVTVGKEGHSTLERGVELLAGERVSIDVALPAKSREMLIESVPGGAIVYLDNRLVAPSTPATLTLTIDDFHQVRLEKTGYEVREYDITPENTDTRLELALEPETRPIGTLWVYSEDAAQIWIDDFDSGFVSPSVGIRVSEGEHTVELRDATGARSKPMRIRIGKGENTHLTLRVE